MSLYIDAGAEGARSVGGSNSTPLGFKPDDARRPLRRDCGHWHDAGELALSANVVEKHIFWARRWSRERL